jgi:hypothetical protein
MAKVTKAPAPNYADWFDMEVQPNVDMKTFEEYFRQTVLQKVMVNDLEERKSLANAKLTKMQAAIEKYFEALKKKTYKIEGVGTVTLKERLSYQTPKDERAKRLFMDWLKEKGLKPIDQVKFDSKWLNAFINEEFEAAKVRGDADFKVPGLEEPKIFYTMAITPAKRKV